MKPSKNTNLYPRVLILNADFTPISLTPWKRALKLVYKYIDSPNEGANIIDYYGGIYIQGPYGRRYPMPAVMQLKTYARQSRKRVSFSKKNIFLRDKMTCMYCGGVFVFNDLEMEHVVPRSKWRGKGTPTNWTNIVTTCQPCNQQKKDRTPSAAGMKLLKHPKEPDARGYIMGLSPWTVIPKEWEIYIPEHYQIICNNQTNANETQ